jgi:hypothetical protein
LDLFSYFLELVRTGVASAHTQDDLADIHAGNFAVGLAEGTAHTSL